MKQPLVVAYGMGVDSTAMLVGFVQRNIVPGLILFADTKGEKPETYSYLPVIQDYLSRHNFPLVTVVERGKTNSRNYPGESYDSLEGNCFMNETLPSLAFGMKGCSAKWKIDPQNWYCEDWPDAQQAWAAGMKIKKAIGYDAGPADMRRGHKLKDDPQYDYWYPLREWGWDRRKCIEAIVVAGLPVPMKSACYFCPASKAHELLWLKNNYPDLWEKALEMERVFREGPHYEGPTRINPKTGKVEIPTQGLGRQKQWSNKLDRYVCEVETYCR